MSNDLENYVSCLTSIYLLAVTASENQTYLGKTRWSPVQKLFNLWFYPNNQFFPNNSFSDAVRAIKDIEVG